MTPPTAPSPIEPRRPRLPPRLALLFLAPRKYKVVEGIASLSLLLHLWASYIAIPMWVVDTGEVYAMFEPVEPMASDGIGDMGSDKHSGLSLVQRLAVS